MRQAEGKRLSFLFIVNRGAGEVRGSAAARRASNPRKIFLFGGLIGLFIAKKPAHARIFSALIINTF